MLNLLAALSFMLNPVEPDFNIVAGYGLEPAMAKAIAVVESGWDHNSRMARVDKNPFGMIGKRFRSLNESIHYFSRLIKKRYRTQDIEVISSKYCPHNPREWASKVRAVKSYLRR